MEYKVISASKYNPFEVCIVEFTGYFEVRGEKSKTAMEETLRVIYLDILNGLKKMHEVG